MDNEKELQQFKNEMDEKLSIAEVERLLSNNVIDFEFKNNQYRVCKPTFKHKKLAYDRKIVMVNKLIKDVNYMFAADLKKVLKDVRGIDIDALDTQFNFLQKQTEEKQNQLGQALKDNVPEDELLIYKSEIQKIQKEQEEISFKKSSYLESSIENQVEVETYAYLTYLITQKKSGDNWVAVWDSYDDFLNTEEGLINLATFYTTIISQGE